MSLAWNDNHTETLRAHLLAGRTYSEIARLMSTTRNVIAGKIHRLGAKKPKPERASSSKPRPRLVKQVQEDPPPEPLLKPGEWPVSRTECRYIYGDPRDPDFRFCGHETVGLSAYCAYHAARLLQPKQSS